MIKLLINLKHRLIIIIIIMNNFVCVFLFGAGNRKIDKFLPVEKYFMKGVYMFDIGQNDLAGAFYSKTLDQILASIPTILAEFEAGLQVTL